MNKKIIDLIIAVMILITVLLVTAKDQAMNTIISSELPVKGKFIPPPGKTMLLIGQDVKTVDNYMKEVGTVPAGFMIYTSLQRLDGLTGSVDYGAGKCDASHYTRNKIYDNTVLQLGLYIVDDLDAINKGKRKSQIEKLGKWIKSVNRPVYLRIGYEFDGSWNHYDPKEYVTAYRTIVDKFNELKVNNVAYIWSSAAAKPYKDHAISEWYPGDEYVDWVGISVFRQLDSSLGNEDDIKNICDFAKAKKLPIAITESTPYGSIGGIPDKKWADWFEKVFNLIDENDIRMFCYINTNWDEQRMWKGQGWGDCRLQSNDKVKAKWLKEISKERYLQSNEKLFENIGYISK